MAAETESLRLDKEKYQRMYEAKKKDCDDLVLRVNDLMGKVRRESQLACSQMLEKLEHLGTRLHCNSKDSCHCESVEKKDTYSH